MHNFFHNAAPLVLRLTAPLLLLSVLALVFSPIARSPSIWVLLSFSALTFALWHADMTFHIRALRPIALPIIAALLVSLSLSEFPWQGATVFRDVIKALVIALAVAIIAQQSSWSWLKNGLHAACITMGLLTLWLIFMPSQAEAIVTWGVSVENINLWSLAFTLLLCGSVAVATFSRASVAIIVMMASMVTFLWLHNLYDPSRGALIAALCTAVVLLLLRFSSTPLIWIFVATVSAFIIGSLVIIIMQNGGWVSDVKLNAISTSRLPIYNTVWDLWQQAPWFGWGLKAFKTHAAVEIAHNMGNYGFTAPHNILLEMLYSLGLIGTALMLTSLVRILWLAMRAARTASNPIAGLLATAIITNLLLHGTTDLSIYRPYFFLLMFSAWGLVQGSDVRNGPLTRA